MAASAAVHGRDDSCSGTSDTLDRNQSPPLMDEPPVRATTPSAMPALAVDEPITHVRRRAASVRWQALVREPMLALAIGAWAKLAIFHLPPAQRTANDWYWWGSTEAAVALLCSLAPVLLLYAPVALLRPTRRYAAALAVSAIVTLVALADVLHFRYFSDIVSVTSVGSGWQLALVWPSIAPLLRPTDLLLVADVVAGTLLLPAYRRSPLLRTTRARQPALAWAMLLAAVLPAALTVAVVARDRNRVFSAEYFRFQSARQVGLLNAHAIEGAKRLWHDVVLRGGVDDAEAAPALALVEARGSDGGASPLFGAAEGRNLLVVMIESLQAFALRLDIDGQPVMPNLRAFADRGISFERFYQQTWEGKTADAEVATMQSLHPLRAGAISTRHPNNRFHGLPAVLAARGYATVSANPYYGTLYRKQQVHPRLGFQRSWFVETYDVGEHIGLGMADGDFYRQTLPRLRALPEPFMGLLVTLSTHSPFEIPPRLRTLRLGSLERTPLGSYLHTLHYADSAFGELLRELDRDGLLERTVVAVLGDHRENFDQETLDQLLTRHAGLPPRSTATETTYWLEERRLPFIVRLPGDAHAGRRHETGGHLDVAPTLMALLGADRRELPGLGGTLGGGSSRLVVMRDGSFVVGDTVCVRDAKAEGRPRCRAGAVAIDSAALAHRFAEARAELAASDAIVKGDLLERLLERRDSAAIRR